MAAAETDGGTRRGARAVGGGAGGNGARSASVSRRGIASERMASESTASECTVSVRCRAAFGSAGRGRLFVLDGQDHLLEVILECHGLVPLARLLDPRDRW